MLQRGFTFIEMLAVVVLLALLVIIAYPIVSSQIKNTNNELTNSEKDILATSAYSYIEDNKDNYKVRSGNTFCIKVSALKQAGKIPVTLKHVKNDEVVRVTVSSDEKLNYEVVEEADCVENIA